MGPFLGAHLPTGDKLQIPDNITLVPLPAYAPELNPMENVWEYLRANKLCNLVWDTYEAIVQAVTAPAVLWFVRDRGTIQGYAVVAHVSHTIAIECCRGLGAVADHYRLAVPRVA